MPVGRVTAEQLARAVADQYAEAERLMTERIARNLAKGLQAPTWAQAKQAQMRLYQAQMQQLIAETERKAGKAAGGAMAEAYKQGGLQAVADLARQGTVPTGVDALAGLRAIERLTEETLGYLRATSPRVLRSTLACYADATSAGSMAGRQIVAGGVGQVVLGAQTRTQAVQGVMNKFAKGGITGFVDKAGKAWNLTSYTEMAMRAGITHASVEGHLDTLQASGMGLVIVSEDGYPCPECVDWEGQILSIQPGHPEYDSVDDAMGGGLFHPGCKHTLSAYQEGVTALYPEKTPAEIEAQAQAYKDGQHLRGLERKVRESKRMEAGAVDPKAAAAARARVREYQAKIRAHVEKTGVPRQPYRERMGVTRADLAAVKGATTPAAAVEEVAAAAKTAAPPVGVVEVDRRALQAAQNIFVGREQRIVGVDHKSSGAVYHPDTRRINVQPNKYMARLADEHDSAVVVRQAMHEGHTFLHETIHGTGDGFATRADWEFYGTRVGRVLEEGLTESLTRRTLPEFMGSMFPVLDEAALHAGQLGSYDEYVFAIDSVADYVATLGQRTAGGFVEELANGTAPMRRADRMAEIILADARLPADLKGPLSDLISQEVTRVAKASRSAAPRDIGAVIRQAVDDTRKELEAKP